MVDEQVTGERATGSQAEGAAAQDAAAMEAVAQDAAAMERLQEEIRNLPVSDHVLYMMHSLSALAVARLGLSPDAAARRDLDQARLAIDCFKALMEVVGEARPSEENAIHRGTLSQLQLAYLEALDKDKKEGEVAP